MPVSLILLWTSHLVMDLMIGFWPVYKTIMGIDIAIASTIAGIGLIIGEGTQILFGFMCGKKDPKPFVLLGLCLICFLSFLAYTEHTLILFLIVLAAYIGSGAFHPAAAGIVGNWSEKKRGFLVALFYAGGTIGAAMSQFTFSQAWIHTGQQTIYFLIPCGLLMLFLLFHRFPKPTLTIERQNFKNIFQDLMPYRKELITLFLIQFLWQTFVIVMMFLLPDLLTDMSYPTWYSLGGGDFCFVIGACCFSIVGGYLADKKDYQIILLTAGVVGMILFYSFLLLGKIPLHFSALMLIAIGGLIGMTQPLIISSGMKLVPAHKRSLASGLLTGGAACLAGMGLLLAGLISDMFTQNAIQNTLAITGMLLPIGLVLTLSIGKKLPAPQAVSLAS